MTITDITGGFVKGNIREEVFEKFLYDNLESFKEEFPSSIFLQMISLDYENENEVIHLKNVLSDYCGDRFDKYTDAFFETSIANGELYNELIDRPAENEILIFDCEKITSVSELQYMIKQSFHFPSWYGMNWDAFNDLVSLNGYDKIVLKSFGAMKQRLPDDADIFLELLNSNNHGGCEIVII